jgi:hypothetical protein
MGTSINQRSPNTPSWRLANAVLGNRNISAVRQSAELWAAALADRDGELSNKLLSPLLAEAAVIANEDELSPSTAIQAYDDLLAEHFEAGLIFDLGRRALVRAASTQSRAPGFLAELFAEVASYYVSRDLPSFVASKGRVATSSEAIELKDQIAEIARTKATREALPEGAESWQQIVRDVSDSLKVPE